MQQDWDLQTYEYMLNVLRNEENDIRRPRSGLRVSVLRMRNRQTRSDFFR